MRPCEAIRVLDFIPVYAAALATFQCRAKPGEDIAMAQNEAAFSAAELQEFRTQGAI